MYRHLATHSATISNQSQTSTFTGYLNQQHIMSSNTSKPQFIMLQHASIAVLVFVVLASPSSCLYTSQSNVVQLTGAVFTQKVVDSDNVWLVEFFAPWCGHCRSLVPEYEKAAKALRGVVKVGAVDMDQEENKPLGGKYGIQGFPTIKIFAGGSVEDFNGTRTADAIVDAVLNALKKKVRKSLGGGGGGGSSSDDAVIELTDGNFDALVTHSDEPILVEFFAPWCGHCKNLAPHWAKAAKELKGRGMRLGALDATVHSRKAQEYGISGYPTIKFFPGGRGATPVDYDGGRTAADIVTWAMERVAANLPAPEVHQLLGVETFTTICTETTPLCVLTFLPHILDCQSTCREAYLEVVRQLGDKHKSKQWGWLWSEAGAQPDVEQALNVGGFGYPTMVVVNVKKQKFTQLRGAFSKQGLEEFLRDLSYGKSTNTATLHDGALKQMQDVQPWDGKDQEMPQEEDIDLSDVDLDDDDAAKDEL